MPSLLPLLLPNEISIIICVEVQNWNSSLPHTECMPMNCVLVSCVHNWLIYWNVYKSRHNDLPIRILFSEPTRHCPIRTLCTLACTGSAASYSQQPTDSKTNKRKSSNRQSVSKISCCWHFVRNLGYLNVPTLSHRCTTSPQSHPYDWRGPAQMRTWNRNKWKCFEN